jgi:hypothetical protein
MSGWTTRDTAQHCSEGVYNTGRGYGLKVGDHRPKQLKDTKHRAQMMRRCHLNTRIRPDGIFGNDRCRGMGMATQSGLIERLNSRAPCKFNATCNKCARRGTKGAACLTAGALSSRESLVV